MGTHIWKHFQRISFHEIHNEPSGFRCGCVPPISQEKRKRKKEEKGDKSTLSDLISVSEKLETTNDLWLPKQRATIKRRGTKKMRDRGLKAIAFFFFPKNNSFSISHLIIHQGEAFQDGIFLGSGAR